MIGGSEAIKQPWRMALSFALADQAITDTPIADCSITDCDQPWTSLMTKLVDRYGEQNINLLKRQMEAKINAPLTSSCGRLFDAMACLLDLRDRVDYEGQAAMELESLANTALSSSANAPSNVAPVIDMVPYPYMMVGDEIIQVSSILLHAYNDFLQGVPRKEIALRFHYTLAQLIADICLHVSKAAGIKTVCLGGGVFQNSLLLKLTMQCFKNTDLLLYFPQAIPANDGGLSLGQATVALAQSGAISFTDVRG
jgi:hydrogenase maturation protein HypF